MLEGAGQSLQNVANRQRDERQARREREADLRAAAEAAAAAAMPDDNQVIIAFEDEDGADDARALQEACRNVERLEWDDNDVAFFFSRSIGFSCLTPTTASLAPPAHTRSPP